MIINEIILALSIIYIIDISGAIQKFNIIAFRWLYGVNLPYNGWFIPVLGCSRCSIFWGILIFNLILHVEIVYTIGLACLLSYLSPLLSLIMKTAIVKLSNLIAK